MSTAPTISSIAGKVYAAMETAERADGSTYVRTSDAASAWVEHIIATVHGTEILPDDHRFEMIRDLAGAIEDAGLDRLDEADIGELADTCVDVYNSDLIAWLGSHAKRIGYVDDAIAEYGIDTSHDGASVMQMIARGQYMEASELAARLLHALDHYMGN